MASPAACTVPPVSADLPGEITAIATALLAAFAIITATFAILAFRKQSKEVSDQAEMLQVQSDRLELYRKQVDDQQEINLTHGKVLELQAKIFTDKVSGKLAERPELDRALAYLREGDVLVITRLSRAMRSLKHLLALADELRGRGVGLVVLKQDIDTTTPTGRLVFHILGAIDEFQRELIVEGTREGLAAARARGRTGGRKPKLNDRQAATVRRMYQATGPDGKRQHTVAEIAEAVGVHRTTVYDYLKKEG